VGDVVIAIESGSPNTVNCVKEGGNADASYAMYFANRADLYAEIIPYKEKEKEMSKTNTLNVGEVGSPRYEVIRKVLAVLDGDAVRIDERFVYGRYNSSLKGAVGALAEAIYHQTAHPNDYQLKSEQPPVMSEKDLKIKEMEDNIETLKKDLELLKGCH
jgi:hypothetical protein